MAAEAVRIILALDNVSLEPMITTDAIKIREVVPGDLPGLKNIIDSTALFPSELLDEMVQPFFQQTEKTEFWLTCELDNVLVAVAYFAPERMTNGTFNLLLIAVHSDLHGRGIGRELTAYIERFLKSGGVRILLVETSGLPDFERTRAFYTQNGYRVEATIAEYYAEGEDKIVFWKSLQDK